MLKGLFFPDVKFETLFIPYIFKEIYLEGIYNDIFQPQVDKPNNDKVVIDVGANVGIVTHYMRQYSKKVYAIEPSPEHFEALAKNKEFNEWDNVEVFQLAIADKDGEMTLHQNDQNRTCNSLVLGYGGGNVNVKTLRFDTFFKENNIEHVDFIKFDVEGAEDMILRSEGFKNVADKIDSIEVEMHFPTWPLLVQYMESLGFKARQYQSSAVVILFFK